MKFFEKKINYKNNCLSKLGFLIVGLMIFHIQTLYAQHVKLGWDRSANPYIFSYNIYRTTHVDSSCSLLDTVLHPDSTYMDDKMEWNTHYYYVATSDDRFGTESSFSNMVDTMLTNNTPVELISFSLSIKNNDDVILEWFTATEINSYGFELQRSERNTKNFKKIGFVRSEGTTSMPKHYSYIDKDLATGEYFYRLKQIDFDGSYQFSDTIQITVNLNMEFTLYQNNPNPFNSATIISYNLPNSCHVELNVYNIFGQVVDRLVDDFQEAGIHSVNWNGKDSEGKEVSSGLYYYKLNTSNESRFRRMLLLR